MQTPSRLLKLAEAAALLGVHPNTLRKWDKNGRLTAVRLGSRRDRRYRLEDVQKLAAPTSYDNY